MSKIVANILNSTRSTKGLKQKAWVFNRVDFTLTKVNNILTTIAKIGNVTGFTASGTKDYSNAGHEAKVFENLDTAFKHKYMLSATSNTPPERANLDQADDIFIVVQQNDGTLLAYGLDYGLWKTSQSQMANDNNGLTAVEFATREGMEEKYSAYFYTSTVASLDALLS